MGGRYGFDDESFAQLEIHFRQWKGSTPRPRAQRERVPTELSYLDEDVATEIHVVHQANRNPRARRELLTKAQTRRQKLLARMKEVGVS